MSRWVATDLEVLFCFILRFFSWYITYFLMMVSFVRSFLLLLWDWTIFSSLVFRTTGKKQFHYVFVLLYGEAVLPLFLMSGIEQISSVIPFVR